MNLTRAFMLERIYANDTQYDGRFITGVLSTGIYCLPSCRARPPKAQNVKFFPGPNEAEAEGLRPCLRCRPDDFYAGYDPDQALIETLVKEIDANPERFSDMEAMSRRAGFGATKLHHLFQCHFHVTPAQYLAKARIASACRLLQSGQVAASEVGFQVGFQSLSAFYRQFGRITGLSPAAYRDLNTELVVKLPAPYPVKRVIGYLNRLEDSSVTFETVAETSFGHVPMRLNYSEQHVAVKFLHDVPERKIMYAVHDELIRWLGLRQTTEWFEKQVASKVPVMEKQVKAARGLVVPQTRTLFEAFLWVIVGQQINLPFAFRLMRRLRDELGSQVAGVKLLPSAQQMAEVEPGELLGWQFSRRKAEYLVGVARWFVARDLSLNNICHLSSLRLEQELLAIRGLGPWSVNYVLMRGMERLNAYPIGDSGLHAALKRVSPERWNDVGWRQSHMNQFAPYRALATMHYWNGLKEDA